MKDLDKPNGHTQITAEDHVLNAHEYLKEFLRKFDTAKRGGIHDFMELTLFSMVRTSIADVDAYLGKGHRSVNANEIMAIVADSYQKVLDNVRRNLESMKQVNFE